jgi:adenylate cyclase
VSRRLRLSKLSRCFQGIVPCVIATASKEGVPNITYLSQVHYLDEQHLALSRQFFNKTHQNLNENPYATIQLADPLTFDAYRVVVRYQRSETEGALFDELSARIQAIASHSGMAGVFRLVAADICEVVSIELIEGFLEPGGERLSLFELGFANGPLTEVRALQLISERINRARDIEELFATTLQAFQELFGLAHTIVLVPDDSKVSSPADPRAATQRLVTLHSHGYGTSGIGAEVNFGEGLIGIVAQTKRLLRVSGLGNALSYGRAIRDRAREVHGEASLAPELPLPGLPNAQAQLALPMLVGDELIGVLAFESLDGMAFAAWHESFLQVLANQIAIGFDRLREEDEALAPAPLALGDSTPPTKAPLAESGVSKKRSFVFFRNDDCVFVDGDYLVRNVPGKILWKLLAEHARGGRTQFTNRELRLDPTLGLPAVKDNLESRLILLRKRLGEKCPDVRIVPTQRGRFALELDCALELSEREHA